MKGYSIFLFRSLKVVNKDRTFLFLKFLFNYNYRTKMMWVNPELPFYVVLLYIIIPLKVYKNRLLPYDRKN